MVSSTEEESTSAGEADRFPQAQETEELTSSARGSVREDESVEDEESTHQEGQNESGEENAEDEKSTDEQEENESREEREEETNHVLFEQRKKVLHDENATPSKSNFADDSDTEFPECIKSIDLTKYNFKTYYSTHGDIPGKIFVKSPLGGKAFLEFRGLLVEQGILEVFKKSCFGHFIDIPMQRINFGSMIVHGLLLRRIICQKKLELWFEYENMPVCFGLREFALMTGLRCHPFPSEKALASRVKKGEPLWEFVSKEEKTVTANHLLEKIKSLETPKNYKFSLALVWFYHCILCARDISSSVDADMTKLACKPSVFNEYPWGLKSYLLTVEYLAKPIKSEYNLYGFPWAFLAWAFEAIPKLQRNAKNVPPERTLPRMLRWMSYGGLKKSMDPFGTTEENVVHPFLFPTNVEKKEKYMKDLEPFFSEEADEKIDMLKAELIGVTTITTGEVGAREVGGEEKIPVRSGAEERSPQSPLVNSGDKFVGSPANFDFGGQYSEAGVGAGSFGVCPSNAKCSCECLTCAEKQRQLELKISKMEEEFKEMGKSVKQLVEELSTLNKKLEPRRMLRNSKYIRTPFTAGAHKTKKRISVTNLLPDIYKTLDNDKSKERVEP
ncbi:uncharacterized protein LOC129902558 [Solanum dulcamara]|uniref:uncharacterized protein LOC129902558 n=1 Tax=Solanum dulcamara TaxID=45834 RepID=UPI0024867B02|nr:uncharacterized protein LOC129902558 [Solanum dulcamara]